MSKPNIYTLIPGGLAEPVPDSKLGDDATKVNVASYLIEYEKDGKKQGMIVDTGMGGNWPKIKKGIERIIGGVKNITHVLLTHLDLDHTQNLKEFSGAIVFHAGQAGLLNKNEYGAKKLYSQGFIEIPEIRWQLIMRAHSVKDTIYLVDSANEGKVAFIGDLIFGPLSTAPIETQILFDGRSSANPKIKLDAVKEFWQKNPAIEKFYLGHHPVALSYQEVGDFIRALEQSQEYQEFLKQF